MNDKPNTPSPSDGMTGAGGNSPQTLPVQVAGAGEDTRDQIILNTTRSCLDMLKQQNITDPGSISATIINAVADELELRNAAILNKSRKMGIPIALEHFQLAEILLAMHDIKKICCLEKASDPDYDLLGVYRKTVPIRGLIQHRDMRYGAFAINMRRASRREGFPKWKQSSRLNVNVYPGQKTKTLCP